MTDTVSTPLQQAAEGVVVNLVAAWEQAGARLTLSTLVRVGSRKGFAATMIRRAVNDLAEDEFIALVPDGCEVVVMDPTRDARARR